MCGMVVTNTCGTPLPPPPMAFDPCCTDVTVSLLGSVTNYFNTNLCGMMVTQTWIAVEHCCGTASTCTRTFAIMPSPPTLLCSDLTFTCTNMNSFTNPPPYVDVCCTNVKVMLLSSVTNFFGPCNVVITQTWGAFEMCCGLSTICTRTLTYVPTPPTLLCTNLTVSCGDTNFMKPPAYVSPCCSNVVVTLSAISGFTGTPCSGIMTQTWLAVEQCCGTSNICTRTVTMVDTNPPSIICPSNMVVTTCSTNVIVTWSVIASDNCALGGVSSSPPSGSAFLPSTTNTVTCTAWDLCSNTNTCTFTIQVKRPTLGALTISRSGDMVTITWADGILQQAGSLLGLWADVPSATPPGYSTSATNAAAFYRLRCNSP
jgi:hypothetical protein